MEQNYPKFRGLLRGAIYNRTQAQFAVESGVSAEHLNRMLNAPVIHRPTRSTLLKLSSAAKNGITYQVLMDALDEDDGTKSHASERRHEFAKQVFKPEFENAAHRTMQALVEIIGQTKYPVMVECIADHVAELFKRLAEYKHPDLIPGEILPVAYDIGVERDNFGEFCKHAARYVNVELSMADRTNTAASDMMIYFTEIPCGEDKVQYAIQEVSCAVMAMMDQFGMPPAALAAGIEKVEKEFAERQAAGQTEDGEDVAEPEGFEAAMKMDYYLDFAPAVRFREDYKPAAKTPEGKLLENLFGITTAYSYTLDGLGFWLEDIPNNLARFLHQHMKPIIDIYDDCQDDDELAKYQKLETAIREWGILEDSPGIANDLDELGYQDLDAIGDKGWGAAVAEVMRAETGFDFYYHAPAEEKFKDKFTRLSAHGCILVEKSVWEDNCNKRESIIMALSRYVRALGLKRFGDILFTGVKIDSRKPRMYVINETDDDRPVSDLPEPDYSIEFDPKNGPWPEDNGLYDVELKDGRRMAMVFLNRPVKAWIKCHKEWSHMIARYCPDKLPVPDNLKNPPEDETDGDNDEITPLVE